jgi:hypothetical protein
MSIQETTVFKTDDGKSFDTREDAEAHALALAIEARINAYVEQLEGSDKAKGRAAGAVRRFLMWEAGQGQEVEA